MVHQIGVQRIVAGDEDHERALASPAGPAGLLPERRHRPRESRQQHRIQPGDVDTQLERVRGRQSAQFTVGQGTFQLAPVLGEVARPVGGHGVAQLRRDVIESGLCAQRRQLRTAPGPDERQRPRSLSNQIGHHAGGFGARRMSHRRAVLAQQVGAQFGLPQRHRSRTVR